MGEGNDLSGTIPREMGQLRNVTRLSLQDMLLTGVVPPELGEMTSIKEFYIEKNGLAGTFPEEVCKLTDLQLRFFVADCAVQINKEHVICECCSFCLKPE